MSHLFWEFYDDFKTCECGPWYFDEELSELNRRYRAAWSSFNEGRRLVGEGRFDKALGCFEDASDVCPEFANPWFWREVVLHEVGRTDEARECYQCGARLSPWDTRDLLMLGVVLRRLGRLEAALRCFDRALEIDPCDPRSWRNKGMVLEHLGKHEDAQSCVKEALRVTRDRDWRQGYTGCQVADEDYADPYDYEPEDDD